MPVKLNNIPLRYKLILGFFLITAVNGLFGFFELRQIRNLGGLVRQTYDQALMSGTFALASKFDYAQYSLEVQNALLADTPEEFRLLSKRALRMLRTLREDLAVFKERSLDPVAVRDVDGLLSQIDDVEETRKSLFTRKEALLSGPSSPSRSHQLVKEWNSLPATKRLNRELTAKYDEAAELGYRFRLEAEEKILRTNKQTIAVLGGSLFLSLILSVILSLIIINPLSKLRTVCGQIAEGNFSIRSSISGKDEFGTLSSVFNLMLGNIDDKTQSMSSLLNTIPFALFYFDSEGAISSERSLSTDILFPRFELFRKLDAFYEAYGVGVPEIQSVFEAMFTNSISFNSAAYLLPKVIRTGTGSRERIISLSYHAKRNQDKKLEKVIIVGQDITERERANARNKELTERVERISKVSGDLPGFKEFLSGTQDLFERLDAPVDRPAFLRDLHSLKGLVGIYNFETVANRIHELETALAEKPEEEFALDPIRTLFNDQVSDLQEILALSAEDDFVFLDHWKITQLKQVIAKSGDPDLNKLATELDRFPFEKVFSKFTNHVQNVLKKLDDKQVEVVIENSDDVSYEEIQRIDPVLIHVLNNSVDHGIESLEERVSVNKPESGKIRVKCRRNTDSSLSLFISDDGKGINGNILFEKAVRSGIIPADSCLSTDEKINLVFASGLSSKSEATILSGRGVGLDAVKAHLESLGGKIQLRSELGSGTTFELFVPTQRIIT